MADEQTKEVLRKSLALLDEEHARGELSDEEYETTRTRYLSYGVDLLVDDEPTVIRTNSGTLANPANPVIPRSLSLRRQGAGIHSGAARSRRLLWIGLIIAIVALTAVVLLNNRGERGANDTITGGAAASSADALAQANEKQTQGDLAGALRLYDQVLKTDPQNVEALAARGWTLYLGATAVASSNGDNTKLVAASIDSLNRAVAVDPSYGPARAWRGVVLLRAKGDKAGAKADFDAYLADKNNTEMRALVESARQQTL